MITLHWWVRERKFWPFLRWLLSYCWQVKQITASFTEKDNFSFLRDLTRSPVTAGNLFTQDGFSFHGVKLKALVLNLTFDVSTQSTNAVWMCRLCDTVYIHPWSCSPRGRSSVWLWHICVFKIYTVMSTHPVLSMSSDWLGKNERVGTYECMCVFDGVRGRVFRMCTFICECGNVYMTVFQMSWVCWCVWGKRWSEEMMLSATLWQEGEELPLLEVKTVHLVSAGKQRCEWGNAHLLYAVCSLARLELYLDWCPPGVGGAEAADQHFSARCSWVEPHVLTAHSLR